MAQTLNMVHYSCANFIDNNLLTPFSSIVTPYTVFAASIVPFLCVITKNCCLLYTSDAADEL